MLQQLLLPNNRVPLCGTECRLAPNEDYLLSGYPELLLGPLIEEAYHFWLSFGKKQRVIFLLPHFGDENPPTDLTRVRIRTVDSREE